MRLSREAVYVAKQIKITWSKSFIGYPQTQRATIKSLGLKKLNQTVTKDDSPELRGQINKVSHLLTVEELD
ncbi:MAG TPA: 50S ribosomal protein L30 [Syntrophomonadaceae bacterium]|nr:50S ribosomal protein L30 [Syntrophomonadaceae bacterium]